MNDYIVIFEKFSDYKNVVDCINELKTLRFYYETKQYDQMRDFIQRLISKHTLEALAWNLKHPVMPETFDQLYINACDFMRVQTAKEISIAAPNYLDLLTESEKAVFDVLIRAL